jgi:AcrR family transcriptional regulator
MLFSLDNNLKYGEKDMSNAKQATRRATHRRGAPKGPRNAEERRAALLESAGKLFVKKGYEATTMDEIAADAGFAKGTLYHYFSNKADLLLSLRQEFDNEIVRRVRAHVESGPADDWPDRIRSWTAGAVEAYFALSALHDLVIYSSGMPTRYTIANSQITQYLAQLIEYGTLAGAWEVEDSHWMAVMMFYAFRGACDEAMVGEQPIESIPGRLHSLFLRMLDVRG